MKILIRFSSIHSFNVLLLNRNCDSNFSLRAEKAREVWFFFFFVVLFCCTLHLLCRRDWRHDDRGCEDVEGERGWAREMRPALRTGSDEEAGASPERCDAAGVLYNQRFADFPVSCLFFLFSLRIFKVKRIIFHAFSQNPLSSSWSTSITASCRVSFALAEQSTTTAIFTGSLPILLRETWPRLLSKLPKAWTTWRPKGWVHLL